MMEIDAHALLAVRLLAMASTSHCPRCSGEVSLPPAADSQAIVRCPICAKQYPLQEALDRAPPELIVVSGSRPTEPLSTEELERSLLELEIPESNGPPHDASAASHDPPSQAAHCGEGQPWDLQWQTAGAERVSGRRRPSLWGRFVGIVLGGVLGLAAGYVALLWLGGPARDFLNIGSRLPAAVLPAAFRRSLSSQSGPRGPTLDTPDHLPGVVAGSPQQMETGPVAAVVPTHEATDGATAVHGEQGDTRHEDLPEGLVAGRPAPTAADVDAAIRQGALSLELFQAGDLIDPQSRRSKGRAYMELCRMAQMWTIGAVAAPAEASARWASDVRSVLEALAVTEKQRDELSRVSRQWLKASPRPGAGIILQGTIDGYDGSAGLRWMRLQIAEDRSLDVLGRIEPLLPLGTPVMVMGLVSDSPEQAVPGYRGGLAPPAVWAGMVIESGSYRD